MAIFTDRIWS